MTTKLVTCDICKREVTEDRTVQHDVSIVICFGTPKFNFLGAQGAQEQSVECKKVSMVKCYDDLCEDCVARLGENLKDVLKDI
jgi:hypothetical protein